MCRRVSRSVRIPTSLSSSTTGTCRNLPASILSCAASSVSLGATVTGFGVMSSATIIGAHASRSYNGAVKLDLKARGPWHSAPAARLRCPDARGPAAQSDRHWVAIQNSEGASQAQATVGAVLDQRRACVAKDLLDRVLAAEPVAAEDLQRVGSDLERGRSEEGLGRDRILEVHRGRRIVVYHHGARQRAACLDPGEHVEQALLDELMLADRLAALDALLLVVPRGRQCG